MKTTLLLPFIALFSVSCVSLKPRSNSAALKYKKEPPIVQQLRIENANLKTKNSDYEAQIREYSGKVEELQIRLDRAQSSSSQRLGQENAELAAYKESVAVLLKEKKELQAEIAKLKLDNQSTNSKLQMANKSINEHMDSGDALFDDKKWTEAITEFQAYRDKAKKSNLTNTEDFALATYKIGVCFQELKMKQEAKTFYNSVLKKNAQTKAAKYAKYRLENLK